MKSGNYAQVSKIMDLVVHIGEEEEQKLTTRTDDVDRPDSISLT